MPVSARAVRIREPGDVDVLDLGEVQVRDPGPGEIRVLVAAAGLNRADLLQRQGYYPAPAGAPADIPGLEYAGTVEAAGPGVTGVALGDRVMGIAGGGAMATHLVVHHREAIPVPEDMALTDAAAIPEVFLTAYDALTVQTRLVIGEVVLVHAAGSGVGTAAFQIARVLGARPVGTSRHRAKLARCAQIGWDEGILVEDGQFAEAARQATRGRGVEVILDTVGGRYLAEDLDAVAPGGRIVVVGLLGGAKADVSLGRLLSGRVRVIGTVLRSRPLEEKISLARSFAAHLVPLFAEGRLRPVVDTILPMADVREAHRRMASNETFGKIVLAW